MSVKYEVLKRLVKISGLKKMWVGKSTEELLENRRRNNARNRIPVLKDDAFEIGQIEVMGCPVVRMIHRQRTDRACLFLIGAKACSTVIPCSRFAGRPRRAGT